MPPLPGRGGQTRRPAMKADQDTNQVSTSKPTLRGIGSVWYGRNNQVGWFYEVTNSLGEIVQYADEINHGLDEEQFKQLVLTSTGIQLNNAELLDAKQAVQRWW